MDARIAKLEQRLKINHSYVRVALAEFLGTFILVLFGTGSVAQYVLSRGVGGSIWTVNISWGLGVTMGVYVAGGVSDGHINPAVSVTLAVLRQLSFKVLPVYIISQYLGAIVASAVVYGIYIDALNNFDGGIRQTTGENATAGIWSTYPQDYLTITNGFFDQVVGTAVLMVCILAITDSRNMRVTPGMIPISIGFTVVVIGTAIGYNCGYAINPARDLGPRIFTAMAGWGIEPFSVRNYSWFWVPVIGPHIGAIVGGILYQLTVALHWPDST